MTYYHGTTHKGLSALVPLNTKGTTLHKSTVYFTDIPVLAALYVWNKPFKWMTYTFSTEEVPICTEWFPWQFAYFYRGVSGMIYSSDSVLIEPTHMQSIFTADKPTAVEPYRNITDAYETILEYEESGLLILRRYETLSEKDMNDICDKVKLSIQKEKLLSRNDEKAAFVKEMFPDIWERAVKEAQ